jgi:hypothetical protein
MRQEVLQAEDAGGHSSWTDFSPLQAAARAGPRLQPHTIRGFQGGAWSGVDGDGRRECPEGFNARLGRGTRWCDSAPSVDSAGGYARIAHLSAPRVTSTVKRPAPSGVMISRPRA